MYLPAKRVCQFLQFRGLLVPDPERRRNRDLDWIEQVISRLPRQFAHELRCWMKVLRGDGRWEHPALAYSSIRRYLRSLFGALKQERMIFRDPSRGLTHAGAEILPQAVRPPRRAARPHRRRPPSVEVLRRTFRPLGVAMSQLRQDRILHEARETADRCG